MGCRADSRFVSSHWETALLCKDVSHWLAINLESAWITSPMNHMVVTVIYGCDGWMANHTIKLPKQEDNWHTTSMRSWWCHQMETFSPLLAIWSPVNSPHKGQWRGALMFSFICVWINGWVNNREAGDLRRYHSHYDIIVMWKDHKGSLYMLLRLRHCRWHFLN